MEKLVHLVPPPKRLPRKLRYARILGVAMIVFTIIGIVLLKLSPSMAWMWEAAIVFAIVSFVLAVFSLVGALILLAEHIWTDYF